MPVYTLNPSHRRASSRASGPSLRERVAAKRRNPEKKHIVLTLHDDRVTWRTSDGRTGSEPKKANFSSGPTTNALLRRLGVIKDGVFQHEAWGIDVLNEDGFPIARFRNPLSEDGVVVSNPRRHTGLYAVASVHGGTDYAVKDATQADERRGFAMSHAAAMSEAKAAARASGGRAYDMSSHHGKKSNPLSEDGVVVSNPAKRRSGGRAQKAGLAKGQSLMAQAAAAYRAGKYPTMQAALKGVARGGAARKNPLSEDGVVVANPAKTFYNVYLGTEHIGVVSRSGRPSADEVRRSLIDHEGYDPSIRVVKGAPARPRYVSYSSPGEEEYFSQRFENPAKRRKGKAKRSGGRTAAQSNAARAMKMFHSGKAASLSEAWDIVRSGR